MGTVVDLVGRIVINSQKEALINIIRTGIARYGRSIATYEGISRYEGIARYEDIA